MITPNKLVYLLLTIYIYNIFETKREHPEGNENSTAEGPWLHTNRKRAFRSPLENNSKKNKQEDFKITVRNSLKNKESPDKGEDDDEGKMGEQQGIEALIY